ncbi:MAG: glycosyltransferase [Anaerolineae bacterium]|nr:glycosyltransferase [Gemmatimonadaceae bacterium]
MNNRPAVSVVIVSDYAAGGPVAARDLRAALSALAKQDFDEPAEFLFIESECLRDQLPTDLATILPSLRMMFFPEQESYPLKNHGVQAASAEFVAILDADCVPDPTWLRRLLSTLRGNASLAAVSGKTVYPDPSFSARICALLARSYLDPGHAGATQFIAINNCAFRRSAYLSHPLPIGIGTFSSRAQSEMLIRDGWTLWFDPEIEVIHDFEGWAMEADLRRNAGHGTIITRLADSSLPYAWLTRLGPISIAPILTGKIIDSWRDCVRCGRNYGVSWYALPAAMLLSIGMHGLEIPGMLQAFKGAGLKKSFFR